MAEPFLAEIRMVGFNFAPRGYAQCDGQILPINQNQSLFSLLGTTFGGDGQTSFALPDLRGRVPVHEGPTHSLGRRLGTEAETLSVSELPSHGHAYRASCAEATSDSPSGGKLAPTMDRSYRGTGQRVAMNASAIANVGGGAPHNNMQPYQVVNMVIALQGVFPSR